MGWEDWEGIEFIREGGAISIGVALTLLIMSVLSWTIMVIKAIQARCIQYRGAKFLGRFERILEPLSLDRGRYGDTSGRPDRGPGVYSQADGAQQILAAIGAAASKRGGTPNNPYSRIALQGLRSARFDQQWALAGSGNFNSRDERIAGALRIAIEQEALVLESGMTLLASIGSLAPFVGLFGTVCGIYHALGGIAASGQTSVDQVAGPVGEALIMTAIGLAVAMPAVLAYNSLLRDNRVLLLKLERFTHDLYAYLSARSLDVHFEAVKAEYPESEVSLSSC